MSTEYPVGTERSPKGNDPRFRQAPTPYAMVAGIYRLNLGADDRLAFRKVVAASCQTLEFSSARCYEEANFDAVCFPAIGPCSGSFVTRSGGACIFASGMVGGMSKDLVTNYFASLGGGWSGAIVDPEAGLWLGRDAAGAHAMFYARTEHALIFSSSMTLLRKFSFAVDPLAVAEFLHFLYVPAPRTIFKEVRALLPGQRLTFDGKAIELLEPTGDSSESRQDSAESLEEVLKSYERELSLALRAACPEGVRSALFLSGGKDSSSLAIAAKLAGMDNVETINLAFDQRDIDESSDAKLVADHLGIPFRALNYSEEAYVMHWRGFIQHLGQPMGDSAALPMFVAMKELGNEYAAYIDGTGNDGYFGIPATRVDEFAWAFHRVIPRLDLVPFRWIPRGLSWTLDLVLNALSRRRQEQFVSWNGWTERELRRLLGRSPDWSDCRLYETYDRWSSATEAKTQVLCGIWEPETAYRKSVQMAAAQGRVVVHPYLDAELVKFSRGLPQKWRYQGETNKIVIRELMRRHLPPEILNKSKGSFVFPKDFILASNGYAIPQAVLNSANVQRHGFVNAGVVDEFLVRYRRGERELQDKIWALVVLHEWLGEREKD